MSICCSKTCKYLSAPFILDVWMTNLIDINAPPPINLEMDFKFWCIWPVCLIFHFASVHLKWALAVRDCGILNQIHMLLLLFTIKALPCICGWHVKLSSQMMKVLLRPYSDYHDRIMPVFTTVLTEGVKITGIQQWFMVLSSAHRDFSRFWESISENLMTSCIVDD